MNSRKKVRPAIRKLSTKLIRWLINTNADSDHTGGNETVSQAGMTVNGNPADIVAHEGVLARTMELNRLCNPKSAAFAEGVIHNRLCDAQEGQE